MGILKDLTDEMKNDPWYVKLRRWWRFKRWVWMCQTRFIWDSNYEHNIFKKRNNMTEDQLRDELENWERVRYRMEEEGMEYCFRHYSSFPEVKDEEFHSKREKLVALMNEIEQYVEDKITEVEDKIIELDEE